MCSTVCGIMLPGSCPKAPPTQYFDSETRTVVYNVPLSTNNPSYLFREINATNILKYKISFGSLEFDDRAHLVKTGEIDKLVRNMCKGYATLNNASMTLNTTIGLFPKYSLACFGSIQEEIRVWFIGSFVFIWTCVDSAEKRHRDEAVIICSLNESTMKSLMRDPKEATKELKVIGRKYLSDAVLEKIDFDYPEDLWGGGNKDIFFTCPKDSRGDTGSKLRSSSLAEAQSDINNKQRLRIAVLAIAVFFIGIALLSVVWYYYCIKC